MADSSQVTDLLIDWSNGDRAAFERLVPIVERELRRRAHHYMRREKPGHALQTTALINEAFIHLIRQDRARWQNRAQFFAISAQIMRRILLNYARDKNRNKRSGGFRQVSLSDADAITFEKSVELIALDRALTKLSALDERKARVVELRFFGGFEVKEMSAVLGVSSITIDRDWKFAQAWLKRELAGEE